jgi:hypothetical protein
LIYAVGEDDGSSCFDRHVAYGRKPSCSISTFLSSDVIVASDRCILPIDDVYVIVNYLGSAYDGFGKCRSLRHFLCVAFILIREFSMLCRGFAQSVSAAINSTVTDLSTAQIPNARIFVRNVDTGSRCITSSGPAADSITDLIPGNYTLQVTKNGLATDEMARFSCRSIKQW